MNEIISQAKEGPVSFFVTFELLKELGFRKHHELYQALEKLKHQGFVILWGEESSVHRTSHAFNDHNWQPSLVYIIPRAIFDAKAKKVQRKFLHYNYFDGIAKRLNSNKFR